MWNHWMQELTSPSTQNWFRTYGPLLILGTLVFIQWCVLQGFLVHYHLFRKNLKQPKPDQLRMSIIEKTISFQMEELQSIFGKLNELRREIKGGVRGDDNPKRALSAIMAQASPASLETSFVSLGEMQLKRRLNEMKSAPSAQTENAGSEIVH